MHVVKYHDLHEMRVIRSTERCSQKENPEKDMIPVPAVLQYRPGYALDLVQRPALLVHFKPCSRVDISSAMTATKQVPA